jgi:hypothetical protein
MKQKENKIINKSFDNNNINNENIICKEYLNKSF